MPQDSEKIATTGHNNLYSFAVIDPHRNANGVDGSGVDRHIAEAFDSQKELKQLIGGAAVVSVGNYDWKNSSAGLTANDLRCVRANPDSPTGF